VGSGCLSDSLRLEQDQVTGRAVIQEVRVGKLAASRSAKSVRPVPSQMHIVPKHDTMGVVAQQANDRLSPPTFSIVPSNVC